MESPGPISAKTSWHSRLLSGNQIHEVRLNRNNLTAIGSDNRPQTTVLATSIRGVRINRGVLHNGLTIRTSGKNQIQADGLPKEESERLYRALQNIVEDQLEFVNNAERIIACALDLRTYIESENPEIARMFILSFVQKVVVKMPQATIQYRIPLPKDKNGSPPHNRHTGHRQEGCS